MTRRIGKPLPRDVKAADVFGVTNPYGGGYDTAGNQPIQSPYTPAVVPPESLGITDPGGSLTFLYVADQGGIEDPVPQKAVIAAMAQRLPGPAFLFINGDWVYFNCDPGQWVPQLYQPFERFALPIIGTPGNHDGDPTDGVPGAGIGSWLANMCAAKPGLPPGDPHDEFGRDTQTQPSHDFGIGFQAVTVLGFWDNVASGGHLEPEQIAWLTGAVKAAPADRPLILCGHHPSYSISADGGSSPQLNTVLDGIFQAAGRWPELVLSGHVHDYQRFRRARPGGSTEYVVCGNGGYHNLHPIAGDYTPGMQLPGGVTCEFADGTNYGYLEISVSGGKISGEYVQVTRTGQVTRSADTFAL